ncbi:hypothetical protein CBS101457_006918 [Exobasidium rhododendri]|nr:hypothetical protein CBS101457_006918 [Exobasidium rhododendri]
MTSIPSQVDVLVCGAGPAGYMLTNALLHLGIRNVVVVDKREAGIEAGQADGIQPRTIEIMQSYGLATRLLSEANYMCMASMYNPDPVTGNITCTERLADVNAPTARWPHELTLHQGGIENIFGDAMKEKGLKVQFGTMVESMDLDESLLNEKGAYPITANIVSSKTGAKVAQVKAKYVVGCDGAHSWTRKWLGYEMQGEQTEYIWGVMDGEPITNFPDWRTKCAIHSHHGSCMVLPRENNKLRLYIQLAAQSSNPSNGSGNKVETQAKTELTNGTKTENRIDRAQFTLDDIKTNVTKILAPYKMDFPKIEWWTIYVIGQRVASAFAKHSRVFICGDACHTHSPKAGQGANASMGDANNLAWKLAMTINGLGKNHLLDTYELERRKFAQDLIAFDRIFAKLFSGKAASAEVKDGISHEDFVAAFRKFGAFSSGIGINYSEANEEGKFPSNLLFLNPSAAEQALASKVTVGVRIPTAVIIRAADARRFQLHDLLPMRLSFRLLLWVGDITKDEPKRRAIEVLGPIVEKVLKQYTRKGARWDSIIEVISIMSSPTASQAGWHLPESMQMFGDNRGWEKILTDDIAYLGQGVEFSGGKAYESFGIDPSKGAALIVRPDNHVAAILSLDDGATLEKHLMQYFDANLVAP